MEAVDRSVSLSHFPMNRVEMCIRKKKTQIKEVINDANIAFVNDTEETNIQL